MDVNEIIRRYELGVIFECGCREIGLHPAIRRSLVAGELDPRHLTRCPVHQNSMIGVDDVVAAGPPPI